MVEHPLETAPKPHHRLRDLVVTWFAAWAVAGLIGAAAGLSVMEFGLFNATASMPHWPLVSLAAHRAFVTSVRARAGWMPTPTITPAEVTAGFRQYDHDCVGCHGGPGISRGDMAAGMTPTPPYILDAAHHWTPAQLYWILAEGVKMTAMPSWRASRTNVQVWNVVAFLEALPYLSADEYSRMRAAAASAAAKPQAGTGSAASAGNNLPAGVTPWAERLGNVNS
jgi:mono/diheme cytochrome c family protein